MVIIEVTFDELYPTAPYLNARIGAKASVSEREDPQEAWSQLKRFADDFHKKNYPNMYVGDQQQSVPQQLPETKVDRGGEELFQSAEEIIAQMDKCETIEQLEREFKYLKDRYPATRASFSKNAARLLSFTK